jgi:hypothetical protein
MPRDGAITFCDLIGKLGVLRIDFSNRGEWSVRQTPAYSDRRASTKATNPV